MTSVKIKSYDIFSIEKTEATLMFLEEQQGLPHNFKNQALPQKDWEPHKWFLDYETPVSAPDILAHFAATNTAKVDVIDNVLIITPDERAKYRDPDPKALKPVALLEYDLF